jgi:tetratricopeptide (TPR) repeat protein
LDKAIAPEDQSIEEWSSSYALWRWQAALAAGRTETTIQEIETWLESHSHDAAAMTWLGAALLAQGRPEEAVAWLDRALAGAPKLAQAYIARGEALLALERFEEAERDLRMALFLDPSPDANLGLARLYQQTGDEKSALETYARAQRSLAVLQSSDLVFYDRAGWPAILPQVVRIGRPHDLEVALELGDLLQRQGNQEAAQRAYEAALWLDPYLDDVAETLADLDP